MSYGTAPYGTAPYGGLPIEDAKMLLMATEQLEDPVEEIKEILNILIKEVKTSKNESTTAVKEERWKVWIPNTPEKVAAYAAIAALILNLLTEKPSENIVINQEFKAQYEVIHKQIQNNTYYLFTD